MIEEERLAAPNGGRRIEDHFVEGTEMVGSGTMPENLPPAESIKKLESQRRKLPKALKRPPSETDITGDLNE
jgi:hypothetical protein